jgi:hypothetical protein
MITYSELNDVFSTADTARAELLLLRLEKNPDVRDLLMTLRYAIEELKLRSERWCPTRE